MGLLVGLTETQPRERVDCAHCGLPVPPALVAEDGSESFCCDGCRAVRALLACEGLERYYALRERSATPSSARPARVAGRRYDELDARSFLDRHVSSAPGGHLSAELVLEGVHCAACVWLVEKLPRLEDGVVAARLDLPRATCRVTWDPTRTSLSRAARRLDSLGYTPHPKRHGELERARRRQDRDLLLRTGVAGAVAGNVMLLAAALYAGAFQGMASEHAALFRWASLAIAGPATLWTALPFLRGALGALRGRALHVDLPVSVGIVAALVASTVNVIRGEGELWLDSAAALVFLLLAGRLLQQRAQRRAAAACDVVASLVPARARIVDETRGEVRDVPLEDVAAGALVEVRPGETVPVDGLVTRGRSQLDLSVLTGESRPVAVEEGDRVHAGCVNETTTILVRVEATGEESRMGRLGRLVEDAASRRAPVVELADRIAGRFVAAVLVAASLTLAAWWSTDPVAAVEHAIALLVITCPCALALATPLVVASALGQAARRGLLVKSGAALQAAAAPGIVLLDKTGTLTEGRLALVAFDGDDEAAALAAALERHGTHPVAAALIEAAAKRGLARHGDARDVERVPGGGLRGRVGERAVAVGAPAWIASVSEATSDESDELGRRAREVASRGETPVAIVIDGRLAGLAAFGDALRSDAADTIARLRKAGARVRILSGDHPDLVTALARRLGIGPHDARGGASPEDKLAAVEAEREASHAPVVMVGDGVNDAAALAAASVGVAVSGGAEASLSAADVYVLDDGLAPIADLVEGSRRAMATIRIAITFSLAYNAIGAGLAMAGLVHPLLAAVLMPLSSLTVITIAFRSRSFR